MLDFYGLKTCDSCRKVRKALENANIGYVFHDLRDNGVKTDKVAQWVKMAGWQTLLNKNSTTWRDLPHQDKLDVTEEKAINLMTAHPTLMKRPIIERNGVSVYVGWSNDIENALKR